MRLAVALAAALLVAACSQGRTRLRVEQNFGRNVPRCIAVVPLENLSLTSFGGVAMGELLAQELDRSRQFVALEPGGYRHLTQNLDVGGVISGNPEALQLLRKELGLEGVVVGTVSEYWYTDDPEVYRDKQPSVTFTARLLDTADGRLVWTATMSRTPGSGIGHLSLLSAVASEVAEDLVREIAEKFTPETSYRFNLNPLQSACKFEELVVSGQIPGRSVAAKPRATVSGSAAASAQPAPAAAEAGALSEAAKALVDRLQRGEPFVLRGVGFDFESHELTPESEAVLATVGELLRAYPDLSIAAIAHTDNMGDPDELQSLSLKYAETIRDVLMQKQGAAAPQIVVRGRGGAEPLLPNINRRNRQINRRIELQLVQAPGGGW